MMDQISICGVLTKRHEIDPFLKRKVTGGGQTRTNDQEGSTVYLVELERNHSLGVASGWPNTKFRSLLSTTGRLEASDSPERPNR
ncbi:hypothetical protein TNCV_2486931 [Trichonephila clavipes]|uniref:Uncharacterized protein n=1 Tax=Trichonephila clavipes TaxID=2585209 RepID=A0A8X6VZX0_TRICX|nr:hypothetical protein TNCV_2486931 [Trichonephila clavipes]